MEAPVEARARQKKRTPTEDRRAKLRYSDLIIRVLGGVLTAGLIALGSISFSVYNNTASNTKDIAYLLKRDEQDYAALVELAKAVQELRESREDQAQTNKEFHAQAIAKINELLGRDRYRIRGREH